ncbi:MAG: type II toxin-antitoxin system death-on-curing family toxin [Planctomycetes bacterium]|nr:type II toxin-antitoxin system death-on-curing family toxin [Planctomycetota bacterium]
MPPTFLHIQEVLEVHRNQIELYGGSEGIRDLGLLVSAIAMPQAGFGGQYLHADIFEMAAAYLFHLAKNHPFIDGNKRTASMAAFTFLHLNGQTLTATEEEFEKVVLAAAQSEMDKQQIAAFFRINSQPMA